MSADQRRLVPHPYLADPGPLAFAHRGGTSAAPENTMAAFRHAVDLGYTYLETDVHCTADGVLVAFHDPDLQRTCGISGTIGELPWSTVSAALVDGREPIPLLDHLLEEFPTARFNIDCKADSAVHGLTSAIRRHRALDRVCIGAFSDRRLRSIRRLLGAGVCTALGPLEVAALRVARRAPRHGTLAAQVPVAQSGITVVTEHFVTTAHRLGVPVHVWTIDEADEMHRLLDLGVDGIMTDRPEVLRDVLIDRGVWHGG